MAGNEVFVDTGIWIAAAREPDAQHKRAKELGKGILARRAKPVISSMVLAEVATFVLKKRRTRTGGHARPGTRAAAAEAGVFATYGFRIIELEEKDIAELDDRLPAQLLRYLPEGYRFR